LNPAFLDTVGLLALWDRADQWHGPASHAFERLRDVDAGLMTTSYVLAECANAAARKPYRLDVDDLRGRLESDGGLIVPTDDDWRSAWGGYRGGDAGRAGLVDHLSFVVMRRLGLTRAFTNDRHFQAAGFEVLF
jgi:predicted nucleic acid-binding protein